MIDYEQAIAIATRCDPRNELLPCSTDHVPSDQEAIKLLRDRIQAAGFNWLTGLAALEAIEEHRKAVTP